MSLGFYKTLFSAPGTSTSSEIPKEEQKTMGLNEGLIRFSVGIDNDIQRTYKAMFECMQSEVFHYNKSAIQLNKTFGFVTTIMMIVMTICSQSFQLRHSPPQSVISVFCSNHCYLFD